MGEEVKVYRRSIPYGLGGTGGKRATRPGLAVPPFTAGKLCRGILALVSQPVSISKLHPTYATAGYRVYSDWRPCYEFSTLYSAYHNSVILYND